MDDVAWSKSADCGAEGFQQVLITIFGQGAKRWQGDFPAYRQFASLGDYDPVLDGQDGEILVE